MISIEINVLRSLSIIGSWSDGNYVGFINQSA